MVEPEPLIAVFCAEIVGGRSGAKSSDDPVLGAVLAAACARGRAAFPYVALDDQTFVRYLARAINKDDRTASTIPALPLEDLYLACACLEGGEKAAVAFATRYGDTIRDSIGRIVAGMEAEDIQEQLVLALLVGSESAPPTIGSYSGRARLDRWVGVAARRAALTWLRRNQAEMRARRAAAAEPSSVDGASPETAYMKERYRGEFERALTEALGRLPERDRVLLRLYLVNGVTVDRIATMFKVGQATVSRWLASARSILLDDIKEALRSRLGTSSDELASLARMVASRLDVTLPTILKVP
jgi:RNA polymerase sigma-70 factor (ECF subfamily)